MNKLLLIFWIFFCVCSTGMAQTGDRCGSGEYIEHLKATQPEAYKHILLFQKQLTLHPNQSLRTSTSTDTIIKIPVVIHIIHNNAAGIIGGTNNNNISDAQVLSQIEVLNNDYQRLNADSVNTPPGYKPIAANVKLQFCLANRDSNGVYSTGITRTYNNQSTYTVADATLLSQLAYWPSDQYLNIWVCDLNGGILGFAQPPGATGVPGLNPSDGVKKTDGVVIDYKAFGKVGNVYVTKYNLGRTTTHEVGHWFGLSHPWGDFNSGDCSLTDYCNDTPPCGNVYESAYPACNNIPSGPNTVVCTPARMVQNYMDYSDDGCMNLFTEDQKSRMRTTIELSARRYALLSSLGCCSIPAGINTPYEKSFEDGDIASDGWTTINPNSSSTYTKGFELSNTSAFNNGSYAISVTNDSVYVETDATTHKYVFSYVSPYFNLRTTSNPKLRFNWAYSPLANNPKTDSIVIFISTGCADNFVPLYTFYGSNFSSTSNPRASFVPGANEWNTTEISLVGYATNTVVHLKFVAYSKGINTFYLDNINILQSSDTFTATLFPNPTSDVLNIKILFNGTKNIDYIIYNMLGQLVFKAHDQEVYSYTKQIDLSSLASGVYLIQVSDGGNRYVYKIVKQ
ncbi:T9SS type A sorting domain-containing protein [Cytophaga aurantiaca]|uniref:T9SS type A sorting domain-containing protein n=1 Tax=Cytophaga aurantiaca TaxID=29530 RepID=UPI00036F8F8B|nr:T9SS type A sorting domain-containing protein [Cytophaga aurantiaca]